MPHHRQSSLERRESVRSKLTIKQNDTLNQFIMRLSKSGKMTPYCTEACLLRYLRARDWDLNKSEKMLLNSLSWRAEEKPKQKDPRDLVKQVSSGKMFRRGKDKQGRPVLYMVPRNENSKDYKKNIDLMIYTLERCVEEMRGDTEQLILVIDFKGWSTRNSPPISVSKKTLDILSNHYPERLGKAIMVDCPFVFNFFWKVISPFINPVTASKVEFVSGSKDKKRVFGKYFDMSTIDKRFMGTAPQFDVQEYWAAEMKRYEKKQMKHKQKERIRHARSNSADSEEMD